MFKKLTVIKRKLNTIKFNGLNCEDRILYTIATIRQQVNKFDT